jgi:hypothetical protein
MIIFRENPWFFRNFHIELTPLLKQLSINFQSKRAMRGEKMKMSEKMIPQLNSTKKSPLFS